MKRSRYWPLVRSKQPQWLRHFANMVEQHGPALPLDAGVIEAGAWDARRLAYVLGQWNHHAQNVRKVATAAVRQQMVGTGQAVQVLPDLTAPAPPAGAEPVRPGALTRIFKLVQLIKASPGYTEGMGLEMGIVGPEDTRVTETPVCRLKVEAGPNGPRVRIRFKKGEHMAVYIEERRGGADFALLAVDAHSPCLDERPLLVADQPEIREYRLRFFEDEQPTGDWSPVQRVIVGPL